MSPPTFRLLPVDSLKIHEEVEPDRVHAIAQEIRSKGAVDEPIWVSLRTRVILNGHHRFAALRELGVDLVPAWVLDYGDPRVRVDRWGPGEPLSKSEIVERAHSSRPFPPKTSRHRIDFPLPARVTSLGRLYRRRRSDGSTGSAARRAASRPRSSLP